MAADFKVLSHYFGLPCTKPAPVAVPLAVKQERMSSARAMKDANALAAQHPRIQIDKDTAGGWWVTCDGLEDDPYDGGNFHTDGRDVLEAVQLYVKLIAPQGTEARKVEPDQGMAAGSITTPEA